MQLNHVCIAVRSIDRASARFCELFGYRIRTDKVTNTRQGVNVQFLNKEGSMDIKLIEPSSRHSPLMEFLKRGEGLHHLCFKGKDTVKETEFLVGKGARLLAAPQPGEAFDDELIAFVYAGMGLNIEIIDTEKRRGQRN